MPSPEAAVCHPQAIEAWRDRRYRRRRDLRLRDPERALVFINDVGFCFLFPERRTEIPTLWEAICGECRPIPIHHDDRALGHAWHWKDELPSRGVVYYGKLLRRKPMFVSLDLLPTFYALSANYGELDDYLLEYEEGKLSEEARRVYEALLEEGAMPTSHLRRRASLAGKGNAGRFDRAIAELQVGLKIVKTGISDANAWKYCYVYDVLMRCWPDIVEKAGQISSVQARRTLVLCHLHNVGTATVRDLRRLFGWHRDVAGEVSEALLSSGELERVRLTQDGPGDGFAWPALLSGTPPWAASRPVRR
jgi:hypothetical protein